MTDDRGVESLAAAIQDLTRVMIALTADAESKASLIRRLSDLEIPPPRVAALLGVPTKQVHAELTKAKARKKK